MQVKFQLGQISKSLRLLTGVLACTGFLVGLTCFLHVFTITDADATTAEQSSTMDMALNLDSAIEIWTTTYDSANDSCAGVNTSRVDISAAPDEQVYTGDACVHVSTNAVKGYTLTMASSTADAKMTHESAGVSATVDPIDNDDVSTSTWAADSSLNNMWAYDLNDTDTYNPVVGSASSETIGSTTAPASDDATKVTYGAKIDISQPSGTYGNTVVFSAVVNIDPESYMQDFTTTACNQLSPWGYNSSTGTVIQGSTKILWDSRDHQAYSVRKLADGNCWMVDNFNLSAESLTGNGHSTTLDYTDTDLTQGTTFTVPATSNTNWGGDSYPVEPKIATSNVPGYTDYGMYYNWWAATARTTDVITGGTTVSGSICPKGWHLPTGAASGELRAVIAAHQAAYSFTTLHGSGNDMSKINRTNLLENDTVGPNLQFSGYWSYLGVVPMNQSSYGNWLSSTVHSELYAYSTDIYSSGNVYAGSGSNVKRGGFSVRCILTPTS